MKKYLSRSGTARGLLHKKSSTSLWSAKLALQRLADDFLCKIAPEKLGDKMSDVLNLNSVKLIW